MKEIKYLHQPVMLAEVLAQITDPHGIYVDATFGRGGHSRAILNQLAADGRLLAMDKDHDAIASATDLLSDPRFQIKQGSYSKLAAFLSEQNVYGKVQGILFDLGVSSPQLDDPDRGFSFLRPGKLDMRMDTHSGLDAATWLAEVGETELADVLWQYGEERYSRRIARAIIQARLVQPILMTDQLADIITKAHPAWQPGKHPATRSFQAIRIFINQEQEDLTLALEQAFHALCIGGQLWVISFHSLEDRMVKRFMQHHGKKDRLPAKLPVKYVAHLPRLKRLRRVKPGLQEIAANPRARSAVLRMGEKIS